MGHLIRWADTGRPYSTTNGASISEIMLSGFWDSVTGVTLTTDAPTDNQQNGYAFRTDNSTRVMRRSTDGDLEIGTLMFRYKAEKLPNVVNTQAAIGALYNVYNEPILAIQLTPSGRVRLLKMDGDNNWVQAAMSTREVAAGTHNHFELQFNTTTGTADLRVNGNDNFIVSATGLLSSDSSPDDTMAARPVASVFFGQLTGSETPLFNGYSIWSDIAVLERELDADPYLGMYGVFYLRPIADGFHSNFLKSTGTVGYSLLNESPPDDDTGFIYSETTGDKSSFTVESLPTNVVEVAAVLPTVYGRKTDSGTGSIQLGVRSGTDEAMNGDDLPLLTDYSYLQAGFDTDPNGDGPWDPTAMPQIIVERTV